MTKNDQERKCMANIATVLFGLVLFLALLGWAGDMDYTEQCILRMSYVEYNNIKDSLTAQYGREPSDREIARYWTDHKK